MGEMVAFVELENTTDRDEAYGVAATVPRTQRPLTVAQLRSLRAAAGELRRADFPREKRYR